MTESSGIQVSGVIDLAIDAGEAFDIVMVQNCDWDESDELLVSLSEKVHNYVTFAADGQREALYPELAHLPWRIVLDCQSEPDQRTRDYLDQATTAIREAGGDLLIRRLGP